MGNQLPGNRAADDADDSEYLDPALTLASVGGLDEHIQYLRQAIVYSMVHREEMKSWGIEAPRGIIFHGPPGTGKTLLAKAFANELSNAQGVRMKFYYQKGPESLGKYFGQTEMRLRGLFAKAIRNKPSIIFFDEIDGLCPSREKCAASGNAMVAIVTAMLGLMDSVPRGEVFIIGATNRLDAVDPALIRPGRFDKQMLFPLPHDTGRQKIIEIYTDAWPRSKPDGGLLATLVKKTAGFTGADICKFCRDAAQAATDRNGEGEGDIHVEEEDWITSFNAMHKSATNVFGSVLFSPPELPTALLPLLASGISDGIRAIRVGLDEDSGCTKAVVICDNISPVTDKFHLPNVVSGMLGNEELRNIPVYLLDENTIIQKMVEGWGDTPLKAVRQIINQAVTSNKKAILYIPRINVVHAVITDSQEKHGNSFLSELKDLKDTNCLLLATRIGPTISEESEEDLKILFSPGQAVHLRKPGLMERQSFLAQTGISEAFLEEAVRATDNDTAEDVVGLYGKLGNELQRGGHHISEVLAAHKRQVN